MEKPLKRSATNTDDSPPRTGNRVRMVTTVFSLFIAVGVAMQLMR